MEYGRVVSKFEADFSLMVHNARDFNQPGTPVADAAETLHVAMKEALAQVRGELTGTNTMYGLPDKLYGFPIVVEKTRKVTTKKGATTSRSQVLAKATPFMCARPGGMVGVADAPNFSTGVVFAYEEMTVETLREASNRRTLGRVVENVVAKVVAPASGVLFQSAA